jgi:hypothetical protein
MAIGSTVNISPPDRKISADEIAAWYTPLQACAYAASCVGLKGAHEAAGRSRPISGTSRRRRRCNGTMLSIGPTGSLRGALGWRSTEPFFVGPEAQAIWCADYHQLRIGAHVTGLRINVMEWSAAGGWAFESDGREGPHMRLGFSARY